MYKHDPSIHNFSAAREILPYVLKLKKINSILDVGCGTGTWLSVALELGVKEVAGVDGEKSYVKINDRQAQQPQRQGMQQKPGMPTQGSRPIFVNYDENSLQVKVEAGVNFAIQKARALQQIVSLMQASPLFAQFMNTEGLPILLDNIEIRGIDQLKQMSEGWMQQMKMMQQQQQQMAMQQANQPNPMVQKNQLEQMKLMQNSQIEQSKLQQAQQKMIIDNIEHKEQLEMDRQDNAVTMMKLQMDMKRDQDKLEMEKEKLGAEHGLKIHDSRHKYAKEALETLHMIEHDTKMHELEEKRLMHEKSEAKENKHAAEKQ